VVRFADPDGMLIELIKSTPGGAVVPWTESPVPAEHVIRGFYGVSARPLSSQGTAKLITETFGYCLVEETGNRARFTAPGNPGS
jgi:glyoxalase family protein